jgi:hypothetical protein
MERKITFSWLLIPISILLLLGFALFVERSGISYTVSQRPTDFLDPTRGVYSDEKPDRQPDCLILFDSEGNQTNSSYKTVVAAFDNMKVPHTDIDVTRDIQIEFGKYKTIVTTFLLFSRINDQIDELIAWVEDGGKLMFAIRPDNSTFFSRIAPSAGITSLNFGVIESNGIEFLTELLPGVNGLQFGEAFIDHTSLPVVLDENTKLHIISADGQEIPILWETQHGNGKIVFINSDQFIDKSSRGLIGSAYSLLQDVTIFPVINASVFYIDDFPAPVPDGRDEDIFRQFTRDIESFFLNVWWPDMQDMKEKYNLIYSSVVIETYEHILEPPFEYTVGQEEILKYFGGIVLRDGGEIGLHGFNHIPFCLEKDKTNQILDYPVWPSARNMKGSIVELNQFVSEMFPDQPINMYVPVSNILCQEARTWLPEVIPNLRVIASVYLPDANVPAYVQEFTEAEDGVIEFPRITSGYHPDNYMQWAAANEIWLHYTAGHFVHPDDVLDSYRNKGNTWVDMRETMDEYLLWLYSSMPSVRNLSASEGAMAVQRYARLVPEYNCLEAHCDLTLHGFYDEGWLLMQTEKTPTEITNGAFTNVGPNLYLIEANEPEMRIGFKE